MATFTAPPIDTAAFSDLHEAQLVFRGVEQADGSFEARVFLNNPDADEQTPVAPVNGYAGSFHVYGFGEPLPPTLREARRTSGHAGALAPIEKRLWLDEATLRDALGGAANLTVTVVAVAADPGGHLPSQPFERVELVVDDDDDGAR